MGPALGKSDHYIHQFVSSINLLKNKKNLYLCKGRVLEEWCDSTD